METKDYATQIWDELKAKQLEVLEAQLIYFKGLAEDYQKTLRRHNEKAIAQNERAFLLNDRIEAILPKLEALAAKK